MRIRLAGWVVSAVVVMAVWASVPGRSAQSDGYQVDAEWARLPDGTNWDGSTSWITADGRGNILVLVRTAPYFRWFTRDGEFVRAVGEDGLFQSAHSVTIDSDGFLWVSDSTGHAVYKFSSGGALLMTLRAWSTLPGVGTSCGSSGETGARSRGSSRCLMASPWIPTAKSS